MDESPIRLTQENSPNDSDVSKLLGNKAYKYWSQLENFISEQYPGIFNRQWLSGGKKSGWYLRFKKSKSFCSFIPEENIFKIQIVFGAKEREQVESVRTSLTNSTQKMYDEAKIYHDGKWLYMYVDNDEVVEDIKKLLKIKRKPKK